MKVAELLIQSIEKLDIPYIFGLPGSTEAPILDTFVEERKVQYILTLHENVTVAMADGYSRASGKAGIVNLHTVVGSANGLSQLYNAFRDRSSLLLLAGHKSTDIHNRDGFCTMDDLPGLMRPFTKWSRQSLKSSQIVDDFFHAYNLATSAPRRPVFLSLPENLLGEEAAAQNVPSIAKNPDLTCQPAEALLQQAAQLLTQAKKPVIIAGDQVGRYGGIRLLEKLAEKIGAVVLREPRRSLTCHTFSTQHGHFAGEYGRDHPAVQETDCIFAAGCRLFVEFSLPQKSELPPAVPLVHLHDDPAEIGKLYPVAVGLAGNAYTALEAMLKLINGEADRQDWVKAHRKAYLNALREEMNLLLNHHPLRAGELVKHLAELLPADAIIVDEGIRSSRPLIRHFPFRQDGSYYSTSGGAIGWGLPASLGVQLAQPNRQVVAFVGDGSALFSVQSLWTAAKYHIPVIFVIVNNGGYLAVKAAIHSFGHNGRKRGVYPASYIDDPEVDFVALAKGYGVQGTSVSDAGRFKAALREGLNMNEPFLIDVRVGEEQI